MWLLTGVMKHFLLIGLFALVCGCAHKPVVQKPNTAPIDFGLPPSVWSSLRDEFVKRVSGCNKWLEAPTLGLEPKLVLHGDVLQELCGDLGLPKTDLVVPLDEAARLQLLALLRDDTPVKVSAEEWADGGCATLNEAFPIFTVSLVFEKQEYRYTIDPIFGFVDVDVDEHVGFSSENLPLSEKFLELCARQMRDERFKTAIETARRRLCPTEAKK